MRRRPRFSAMNIFLVVLGIGALVGLLNLVGWDIFAVVVLVWNWLWSGISAIANWFMTQDWFLHIARGPQ